MKRCVVCEADAKYLTTTRRPDYESPTPRIRIVDLFSGGGGLSLGFAEAARRVGRGIKIVAAVEVNREAADIFSLNFPGAAVRRRDIDRLFHGRIGARANQIETRFKSEVGRVDVMLAGPPCQGHSDLNNHTRRNDTRNDLYLRVVRGAEILNPRCLLVENVPMVQRDAAGVVPAATEALESLGYRVATAVIDLTDLGVPQRRRRHLLLASRSPRVDPRAILETSIACSSHSPRTVAWAIRDLARRSPKSGPDAPSAASPENVERMEWMIENSQFDLPNEMRPVCHHNEHSYTSMYGRLRWDRPAQTITTGYGSMGQGRYVHPSKPRTITPHEAARLQTFPDFFDLGLSKARGTWAHVIGNAVPPLLGVHIGVPLLANLVTQKADTSRSASRAKQRGDVPTASSETIRKRMSNTRRRDTGPELRLRAELDRRGLRYLVDHPIDAKGRRKADVVFPLRKIAVYVNGCYWHGCAQHGTTPKSNREWWKRKIAANRARDADTDAKLAEEGWLVLRFWEHDDLVAAGAQVAEVLAGAPHSDVNGWRVSPARQVTARSH